jgi:stage III sporulation protein AD
MDVIKLVGFSIFAIFMILTLKDQRKDIALVLSIAAGIGLLIFSITKISAIVEMLDDLILKSGINKEFFTIILKVTGISYIIEFGKNICTDAGESGIATKLEMAGKVIIVSLSLPLISALVNSLSSII